jgi:hypothetical protein
MESHGRLQVVTGGDGMVMGIAGAVMNTFFLQ